MRFDWTDLQLFVHACELGSITGAAQRAHLTLAAASARIRGMEEQAGAALLQRHSRGVRPTAAGLALSHHARAVLAQLQQLRGELAQHRRGARGSVRLMCNTSALLQHLPAPLAAFLNAHAWIDVDVHESPSHLTVQALREGAADMGILSDAVDTSGLETHVLCDDPLVLAMPRGHALGRLRRLSFGQALEHDLVGMGTASALHAHLAMQAAHLGRPMRVRVQMGSFQAVCAMVMRGVGAAVLPLAALGDAKARLVVRPLTDAWARRRLLLCGPAGVPSHAPAAQLAAALRAGPMG